MKIQIKFRWSDKIIFEGEYNSMKDCVVDAVLRGAVLRGADLSGADLRDAVLRGADLSEIKNDFLTEVLKLPDEIPFLKGALLAGKIDGSTYTGSCACLAGTMANAKELSGYRGENIPVCSGMEFIANSDSPRERWFLSIKPGDTPENSQIAKITLEWIDEALAMVDHIRSRGKVAA